MSLVTKCENCDARVMKTEKGKVFDAPEKGILEETAPGRPMMPDSLRLVVYDGETIKMMPRNMRSLYLNLHRCGRR